MWYIHITEYYSALKEINYSKQKNLRNVIPSERSDRKRLHIVPKKATILRKAIFQK
jgi:hypothetical protein